MQNLFFTYIKKKFFFGAMGVLSSFLFFTNCAEKENDIQVAITNGIHFLDGIQRADGAICDTVNPLFDTWETVLCASALLQVRADTNDATLHKALVYLRQNENTDGLICHNKKCKSAYCLETTAAYFLLLRQTGKEEQVKERSKRMMDLQKPTGEWEIGNPDVRIQKDFPSVTGFALGLLQTAGLEPKYPAEAFHWLLQKQTPEGDWGAAWEYYDCPAYALWPILRAIKDENTPEMASARQKAIHYIIYSQNSDGAWDFSRAEQQKRPSAELQTALMLSALAYVDFDKKEEITRKAVAFLLDHQQKNGSWDGGYFPIDSKTYEKKEYVFATALALSTLENYFHKQQVRK